MQPELVAGYWDESALDERLLERALEGEVGKLRCAVSEGRFAGPNVEPPGSVAFATQFLRLQYDSGIDRPQDFAESAVHPK